MFEPDHVVTPPATKAAPKSNEDIISQAFTQPSGSQSSSKRKQAAPSEKLSESPTRELRRSKRTKGNVESMGSETPAERSKRRKEEKEPPDKYTPRYARSGSVTMYRIRCSSVKNAMATFIGIAYQSDTCRKRRGNGCATHVLRRDYLSMSCEKISAGIRQLFLISIKLRSAPDSCSIMVRRTCSI